MFEIYCIVPSRGDKSSRDDLLEYSLREIAERHTLRCWVFGDVKEVIACIVENCIGYSVRHCFGDSATYVKCPFVVKENGKTILDSKLSPQVGVCSVYMGSREVLELEVAMGLEVFFSNLGDIKNGEHTDILAAEEQELSKYQNI